MLDARGVTIRMLIRMLLGDSDLVWSGLSSLAIGNVF